MPALPEHHKQNFQTLIDAAIDGRLALLDCADTKTGQQIPTIVAVNYNNRKAEYVFVPLARMFLSNPYDEVVPPPNEPDTETNDAPHPTYAE